MRHTCAQDEGQSDLALGNRIDEAYRAKYRSYGVRYTDPMITPIA